MKIAMAVVVCSIALSSCDNHQLLPRDIIQSPRFIDIIADPPEINPGQSTTIHAVTGGLVDRVETTFRWTLCVRPESTTTFTAESTFGVAEADNGCFGDAAVTFGGVIEAPTVTYLAPADLFQHLDALRAAYGSDLSVDALNMIVQTVGVPVTVAVEMRQGNVIVQGIKRVIVSGRMNLNHNPPPPQFRFGGDADAGVSGTHLTGSTGDDPTCTTDDGSMLTTTAGQHYEIAPDPTESAWLEDYDTLDSSGALMHATETPFYSWYATTGSYASDRTRIPTRNTIWYPPHASGTYTLWLGVRDGRGGSSICRFLVRVQ